MTGRPRSSSGRGEGERERGVAAAAVVLEGMQVLGGREVAGLEGGKWRGGRGEGHRFVVVVVVEDEDGSGGC